MQTMPRTGRPRTLDPADVRKPVAYRMNRDELAQIDALAGLWNVTGAEAIRRAVAEALEREQGGR